MVCLPKKASGWSTAKRLIEKRDQVFSKGEIVLKLQEKYLLRTMLYNLLSVCRYYYVFT